MENPQKILHIHESPLLYLHIDNTIQEKKMVVQYKTVFYYLSYAYVVWEEEKNKKNAKEIDCRLYIFFWYDFCRVFNFALRADLRIKVKGRHKVRAYLAPCIYFIIPSTCTQTHTHTWRKSRFFPTYFFLQKKRKEENKVCGWKVNRACLTYLLFHFFFLWKKKRGKHWIQVFAKVSNTVTLISYIIVAFFSSAPSYKYFSTYN